MDFDKLEYGGVYGETTAIRHILSLHGATAAHNGKPLSEAMLFGISGGIGFAYFNFEYDGSEPTLYIDMGQRYNNRFGQVMDGLYRRLGLETTVRLTKSAQQAEANLANDLAQGVPVILHIDRGSLPHYVEDTEYGDHAIVVLCYDDKSREYLVADQACLPLSISPPDLSSARESIDSLSFRSLTLSRPENPIDLTDGITRSLRQCWDRMLNPPHPRTNFGLSGLEKWASLINNSKARKGWLKVFTPGLNLYMGLHWTYKCIQTLETGGGAMRGLYADFLEEAEEAMSKPRLKEVAKAYRDLDRLWTELAQATLPDEVPLLHRTRQMIDRAEQLFLDKGIDAIPEINDIRNEQVSMREEASSDFPLDKAQSQALLDDLHERLLVIVEREQEAVQELKTCLN
ncbi:MAG: BtrH N-terminal domain-containing protein [Candidatus Neomarinimicrobiota bacterium]